MQSSHAVTLAQQWWRSYERVLQLRPIRTKGAVSAFMFAFTDVAVQHIEHDHRRDFVWDRKRTAAQALFGCYYGVVHAHFVWAMLEKGAAKMAARGLLVGLLHPPLLGG